MTSIQVDFDLEPEDMELLSRSSSRRNSYRNSTRTAELLSPAAMPDVSSPPPLNSRVTSNDHVALQFFWQGYEVYVHSRASDSVAPCFYKSQCGCTATDGNKAEFVRIIPVTEVPERSIMDEMRVQIVSVSTQRYLRATRVSKYLKWSENRDEQTVFQIQILDRSKPLTRETKFTLSSTVWPEHYVGFTQTCPLSFSRDLQKAVGFLTMEKKKHQAPLIFPLRLRAVHHTVRFIRYNPSPSFEDPVPFVTTSDMLFINDENQDDVADVPVAILLSNDPVQQPVVEETRELCPYCMSIFRQREGLLSHIRDNHGDWLHRESVAGSFCIHCGSPCIQSTCVRCQRPALHM